MGYWAKLAQANPRAAVTCSQGLGDTTRAGAVSVDRGGRGWGYGYVSLS